MYHTNVFAKTLTITKYEANSELLYVSALFMLYIFCRTHLLNLFGPDMRANVFRELTLYQ